MSGRIMVDAPPVETRETRRETRQEVATEAPPEAPGRPAPAPLPPPAPEPPPPLAPSEDAAAPTSEQEGEEPTQDGARPETQPDYERRIGRLTRERYEWQRRHDELQRQVQTWQAQQRQAQLPPGQTDPEERALQRFRQEAAERDFNARCNAVFQRGSEAYNDFGDAVQALNAVGYGSRPDALAFITGIPEAHHVYHDLSRNLDNARRLLDLPPPEMATEFAVIAARHRGSSNGVPEAPQAASQPAEPAAPVTRAPEPLRPVGGLSRAPERPLSEVSMADFIRRRDRETGGGSRRIMR